MRTTIDTSSNVPGMILRIAWCGKNTNNASLATFFTTPKLTPDVSCGLGELPTAVNSILDRLPNVFVGMLLGH